MIKLVEAVKSIIISLVIFSSGFVVSQKAYASNSPTPQIIAKDMKIFVVDPKAVIEQSKAFAHMQKQIERKHDFYKKDMEQKQQLIHNMYKKLNAQRDALTEQEYEEASKAIAEQTMEYNKNAHTNRIKIDNSVNQASKIIEAALDKIMAKYVAEYGGNIIILNKLNIIYNDSSIDLTNRALEDLNILLPFVNID